MKAFKVIVAIGAVIAFVILAGSRLGVESRKSDRLFESSRIENAPNADESSQAGKAHEFGRPDTGELAAGTKASREQEGEAPVDQDQRTQFMLGRVAASDPRRDLPQVIELDDVVSSSLDESVIGRPFVVSPAARPRCIEAEGGSVCDRLHRLEQFTNEPRDLFWASQAESVLRSMTTESTYAFSIRNVECRVITCIIEVESNEGVVIPEIALKPEQWRTAKIKPFGADRGDQSGPTGQHVILTLWIFQRIR